MLRESDMTILSVVNANDFPHEIQKHQYGVSVTKYWSNRLQFWTEGGKFGVNVTS